jgi:hypothetical protein
VDRVDQVERVDGNVPEDVVIEYSFSAKHRKRITDLKLDPKKFRKVVDEHVIGVLHYVNDEDGVTYEVQRGRVHSVEYGPAKRYKHLSCRDPADKKPAARGNKQQYQRGCASDRRDMLLYNSRRTSPGYSWVRQDEEGTNNYPPLGLRNNDPAKLRDAAYKPIALLSIKLTQVLHRRSRSGCYVRPNPVFLGNAPVEPSAFCNRGCMWG